MIYTDITRTIFLVFAGLSGVLIVGTVVSEILFRRKPSPNNVEVRLRVRSWWVIVVLFALAIMVNRATALFFFSFVSFLALKEYYTLIPTRQVDRTLLFWTYLAIPIQYYFAYIDWYGMFIIFIPVYMFLFLPLHMVITGSPSGFIRSVSTLQWGLMVTVFSLSHAAYLLVLPGRDAPWSAGAGLLLYLILLTQLNDVFQFLWGRAVGKKKVAPTISPGKTWGGLIWGVVTTISLSALVGPYLTPMTMIGSMFAGLLIGVAGFFGDTVISSLKRDLRIKDTGNTIPGHGGILDRVDSLTYTAPVFFHYFRYFFNQ